MKVLHRLLIVWLLLLALPFQGLASATMLPCAPPMPMAAAAPAHGHAAMAQAMEGHCAPDAGHGDGHDAGSGACTACCIGAAMAPAVLPAVVLTPSHFVSIPFRASHLPSVDPALPERPPRTAHA